MSIWPSQKSSFENTPRITPDFVTANNLLSSVSAFRLGDLLFRAIWSACFLLPAGGIAASSDLVSTYAKGLPRYARRQRGCRAMRTWLLTRGGYEHTSTTGCPVWIVVASLVGAGGRQQAGFGDLLLGKLLPGLGVGAGTGARGGKWSWRARRGGVAAGWRPAADQ